MFHLRHLTGTGEDVNTPVIETNSPRVSVSDETHTVTTELELTSETNEFCCHMVPLVTPDIPAKLSQVTETTYIIEFKVKINHH